MKTENIIALSVLGLTALAVLLTALGVFGERSVPETSPPADVTVLVTADGVPAEGAVLVTPDGIEFPVDPNTAQIRLPSKCAGEVIIIRDRKSRRELKRFVPTTGFNIIEI